MKYKRKEISREICAGVDADIFSVFASGAYFSSWEIQSGAEQAVETAIGNGLEVIIDDSFGITDE